MIERIARVIAKGEYGERVDDVWPNYVDDAVGVLQALREPTDLMGNGLPSGYRPGSHSATEVWRAMIDAALAEEPE